MPTDKEKAQAAVAGGAAAAAAPFTPTRVRMPQSEGSKRAAESALKTGRASTSDLRAAYRGMGGRLGNDSHTARLAQGIKEKGYDDSRKVKIKRFKNGESMVVGGHHRIAASEMIGKPDLPVEVQHSSGKAPYSIVPLYARGKYKRDVQNARIPGKELPDEEINRVASKKTPRIHQSVNSAKAQIEEGITALKKPKVGIPVAVGAATVAGGTAYKNKDKIKKRDQTVEELARSKRQQANLSAAGATLGAGALGLKATEYGVKRSAGVKPDAVKMTAKQAKRLKLAHRLDRTSLGVLTTAAGVGSVSGYKFARVQREEAKRLEKRMSGENAFGVVHEISKQGKHSPPSEPSAFKQGTEKAKITLKRVGNSAKAFSGKHPYATTAAIGAGVGTAVLAPGIIASESASRRRVKRAFGKARGFDPEDRRERRQKVYVAGLVGGTGAAGASAYKPGKKAIKEIKRTYEKGGAKKVLRIKTLEKPAVKAVLTRGGAGLAAATTAGLIANQSRGSGRRYKGWYS